MEILQLRPLLKPFNLLGFYAFGRHRHRVHAHKNGAGGRLGLAWANRGRDGLAARATWPISARSAAAFAGHLGVVVGGVMGVCSCFGLSIDRYQKQNSCKALSLAVIGNSASITNNDTSLIQLALSDS
jgi:hypothetical protein